MTEIHCDVLFAAMLVSRQSVSQRNISIRAATFGQLID